MVVGAHGRDGRVRIIPTTDNPDRFKAMATVYIDRKRHIIRDILPRDQFLLLNFTGLKSREDAIALIGSIIEVPESDIPSLPEGSYYHFQLLGMSVHNASGVYLGQLAQILNTGANDIYVVENMSQELLVPAIGSVIISVDLNDNQIIIDLPEGLMWTNTQSSESQGIPKSRRRHKGVFRRTK